MSANVVLLGAVINGAHRRITAEYYGNYAYGEDAREPTGAAAADPSERV